MLVPMAKVSIVVFVRELSKFFGVVGDTFCPSRDMTLGIIPCCGGTRMGESFFMKNFQAY